MIEKNCPDCDDIIKIPGGSVKGEVFGCGTCGSDWEITTPGPEFGLVKAEEIGEDWGQ